VLAPRDSLPAPENSGSAELEALIASGDKECIQSALRVLAVKVPVDAASFDLWRSLALHEQRDIRADALAVVSRLDRGDALQLLSLWENDSDPILRRRTVTWFLIADDAPAQEAAIRFARDVDENIRLQAARWLAKSTTDEGLRALAQLAVDRAPAVRRLGLDGLHQRHPGAFLLSIAILQRGGRGKEVEDARRALERLRPAEVPAFVESALTWIEVGASAVSPEDVYALLRFANADTLAKANFRRSRQAAVREAFVLTDGDAGAALRLQDACDDEAESVRARAVAMLARLDADDPGRVLAPVFKHKRADVRQRAMGFLEENASRVLPKVRAALGDSDAGVRRAAYETMARVLNEDALDVWLRALRDPDAAVRGWAFEQISAMPWKPRVREALVDAATSRDASVRVRAAATLASHRVFEPRLARSYAQALERALEESVSDRDRSALTVALVKAVSETAPAGSLELLLQAARAKSAPLRRAAVDALLARPRRSSLMAAAALADTDDPDILRRIAEHLAVAVDPRGLIPLLRALDECPGVGEKLRSLLAAYPQTKQLRSLLKLLKERWPSVKRFALKALVELESPEMIEPLLAATKDPDVEVQRAAVQALAKFAKQPEVEKRLMELRDACDDETTRQHAIAMLLGMDPASVIEPLLQASRDDDIEVQYAAVQALGKYANRPDVSKRLIELLDYGDISVREKAMETLGEYQVKDAVEPLIRYLGNPFLKFRAQEALMRIGDRKGILAIKRFKIREKLFGKKKSKGPVAPVLRKGRLGRPRDGRG